jgi:hypothetical protein
MVLATHGRTIWILDHLEPIQEYTAAQAVTTDARLFTPPPSAMYRRPARDRNYEFWGDLTFYGENPPQAAVISWLNKKQVGEVKLRITDAAGREVRELSGTAFATSNKPGIQSACWDLRVQPAPAPPPQEGRAGRGERGQTTAEGAGRGQTPDASSPYGAACPAIPTAAGGGGGGFGGGNQTNGPFVLGGTYNVALIVDGKTIETKPLRVADDPDVVLTSADRKRQYDMAMEMHALQPRLTEVGTAFGSLSRQVNQLSTTVASRSDVPADVKSSLESFKKELDGLAPRLSAPQGGRGGGGGRGNNDSVIGKAGQAKNGFMSGMVVGEQALRAYTEVKSQAPKAVADLNAAIAKAGTLSASLAKYNLTLTVPQPVKAIEAAPARKPSSNPKI